jgi:hypothetical protein
VYYWCKRASTRNTNAFAILYEPTTGLESVDMAVV